MENLKEMEVEQLEARKAEIMEEIESPDADLDALKEEARSINLLFFLPTAIISSCFRAKQGQLRLRPILWGILFGAMSAASFSLLSKHLEPEVLQKLFAALLLFTGVRELFYRPRKAK